MMEIVLSMLAGDPEETGLLVQTVGEKSLLLPTVDNPIWLTLLVEEVEDYLKVSIGDLSEVRNLYDRVLDDEPIESEVWELPKEAIAEFSEVDPQAIFKIAAILDVFDGVDSQDPTDSGIDPDNLIEKIQVLSQQYALELIFEEMLNATHEAMESLLNTESEDEVFRIYAREFI